MRQLTTIFLAGTIACGPGLLARPAKSAASTGASGLVQPSADSHNSDPQGEKKPANPKSGSPESDPTRNNPDVPHQEPGTDNPDVSKQREPRPAPPNEKGNTNGEGGSSKTGTGSKKSKRKNSSSDTHSDQQGSQSK